MYAYENKMSYGRPDDVGDSNLVIEPVHEFFHIVVHIGGRRCHIMDFLTPHGSGNNLNVSTPVVPHRNRIRSTPPGGKQGTVPTKNAFPVQRDVAIARCVQHHIHYTFHIMRGSAGGLDVCNTKAANYGRTYIV